MSQVKWPTPNPSGAAAVDLRNGPTAELLQAVVHNLPTFIAIEPLLLFLKDTYHGGGLGSSAAMSDITDDVHEKGSLPGSPKRKETISNNRECTLQLCSSKGKEPVCDNPERSQSPCSSNVKEAIHEK